MQTITKRYPEIPFAHRQPMHDGHCRFIHGHNWTFEITLTAVNFDKNGFVVDFGDLKWLKQWIDDTFDHACVLPDSDPQRQLLLGTPDLTGLFKLRFLPDVSCEGLSRYVCDVVNTQVKNRTDGRVWVTSVTVFEDARNSATFTRTQVTG